jgi:hypothetical protein
MGTVGPTSVVVHRRTPMPTVAVTHFVTQQGHALKAMLCPAGTLVTAQVGVSRPSGGVTDGCTKSPCDQRANMPVVTWQNDRSNLPSSSNLGTYLAWLGCTRGVMPT